MEDYHKPPSLKQPKKNIVSLKVIDFTIWNGIKFGIGLMIGTTIGSIILALVLGGLAFILGFGTHAMSRI